MGGQKPAFPNHGNIGAATNYWGASLLFKTQSMQCVKVKSLLFKTQLMQCVNVAVFDGREGVGSKTFKLGLACDLDMNLMPK